MLARGETDREIAVAEHGADALAFTALAFDKCASSRTALSAALIVVIGSALALPRARQVFGSATTDGALGRFGSIGVGNLPEGVGSH
jgi:hypothetical protein